MAIGKISTDTAHRAVPRQQLSFLLVLILVRTLGMVELLLLLLLLLLLKSVEFDDDVALLLSVAGLVMGCDFGVRNRKHRLCCT